MRHVGSSIWLGKAQVSRSILLVNDPQVKHLRDNVPMELATVLSQDVGNCRPRLWDEASIF